jgi:carbon monoxide dehydrogenase subunit G
MAIRIENSFHVPAGIEQTWRIISDVPRIASCMPGTQLTGVAGDGSYRGHAKVKIGPVQLQFNGEARVYDVDPLRHSMKVRSRASDAKGRGTVASEMGFALVPDGERTRVDVVTELTLTGAVAQYGRGAGLIREVANQFTKDFAANLEKLVREEAGAPEAEVKPVSAFRLLFAAMRALVLRWLGRKQT